MVISCTVLGTILLVVQLGMRGGFKSKEEVKIGTFGGAGPPTAPECRDRFKTMGVSVQDAQALQTLYPSVLKLAPRVDCSKGRYLRVTNFGQSGFGHMHSQYNTHLLFAMATGLTLVHENMVTTGDHGGENLDKIMFTALFSVPLAELMRCPRNTFARASWFVIRSQPAWLPTIDEREVSAEKQELFQKMLREFGVRPGEGFTLLIRAGGLCVQYMVSAPVYRLRLQLGMDVANTTNRELVELRKRVVAVGGGDAPPFMIAVHVRRGDILEKAKYHNRILSTHYYTILLAAVLDELPSCARRRAVVVIFTEGNCCEFNATLAALNTSGITIYQGSSTASFLLMTEARVIITSQSGFSRTAAFYAHSAVVLGAYSDPVHSYEGVVAGVVMVEKTPDGTPVFNRSLLHVLLGHN